MGAGVAWTGPRSGLVADVKAHTLVARAESGYEEWRLSGALTLPAGSGGRGLSMSSPRARGGSVGSGGAVRRGRRVRDGTAPRGGTCRGRSARRADGLRARSVRGALTATPRTGLSLADGGRDHRLGWRLAPTGDAAGELSLGIEAPRRERTGDQSAAHGIEVRFGARW